MVYTRGAIRERRGSRKAMRRGIQILNEFCGGLSFVFIALRQTKSEYDGQDYRHNLVHNTYCTINNQPHPFWKTTNCHKTKNKTNKEAFLRETTLKVFSSTPWSLMSTPTQWNPLPEPCQLNVLNPIWEAHLSQQRQTKNLIATGAGGGALFDKRTKEK